jgi:hypothetical protein
METKHEMEPFIINVEKIDVKKSKTINDHIDSNKGYQVL